MPNPRSCGLALCHETADVGLSSPPLVVENGRSGLHLPAYHAMDDKRRQIGNDALEEAARSALSVGAGKSSAHVVLLS